MVKVMRTAVRFFFLVVFAALVGCGEQTRLQENDVAGVGKIQVGVFDGHGGSQTCVWEAFEAVRLDSGMEVHYVTSAALSSGALESLDVLIIPGGGGSRQYLNMGFENHERLRTFVRNGGGIVGICAGAYLLSSTPEYACLHMSGGKAIDIEHDNRGHGLAKLTLTEAGKTLFPEVADRDTCYIVYYEGPVYDTVDTAGTYISFGTMESDVHTEGNAPSNMTNGRPFFIGSEYGEGRTFSCIAHPEATPGMQWMIPRMVRWASNSPFVEYSPAVVEPDLLGREILFTRERLKEERSAYEVFLYGEAAAKLERLDWLEEHVSWDAKRWLQGLLYDQSPSVRARAASYIARSGFTQYLPDVEASYSQEEDATAREQMKAALERLKSRVHQK